MSSSIAALLEAAEFLDQRERERELTQQAVVHTSPGVIRAPSNPIVYYNDHVLPSTAQVISYSRGDDLRMPGTISPRYRRNEWAEHGYASTLPMPQDLRTHSNKQKPKLKKTIGSRTSHNELEKNRRAHLRVCLEKLKDIVPLGNESSRHTTLGLLKKAKKFIETLEDKDHKNSQYKDQLSREHRYLKRRLEQLSLGLYSCEDASKRRSVSECSTSTASSSSSSNSGHSSISHSSIPSPVSESDEVDVIGYTSNHSDSDDLASSGRSANSAASGRSGQHHHAMSRLRISEINLV